MGIFLSSLRRIKAIYPPIMVAYGVHGVGKTTFGIEWPDPVFIQCEDGTPGGPNEPVIIGSNKVKTFKDILNAIGELVNEDHDYKTLVIDSLDAMEPLVWAHVAEENKWDSVESPGYGKGYVFVDVAWRDFLDGCRTLTRSGVAVVLIAHSDNVKFNDPIVGEYSRYVIKLHKRGSALVQEAADIVGFFNYRTTLKTEDKGFKKITRGVGGGDRQMHFEERPSFLAKNRYQMPESVEYRAGKGYEAIAKYFPQPTGVGAQVQQAAE
jgi:hypothetical protein